MGISNGLNEKFIKERFVELVFVLSVLNIIFILALGFFIFQFLDSGKLIRNSHTGINETYIPPLPSRPPIELPKVIYNFSGTIAKLEKDAIVFNAEIIGIDEKGEITKTIEPRKANIGSSANIKKLVFVKNSPVESAIKLSDLKVGDYIEVISDQDISAALEFSATQVRILP